MVAGPAWDDAESIILREGATKAPCPKRKLEADKI
jgi:hypothetical protein